MMSDELARAQMRSAHGDTEAEVIAAWNRRSSGKQEGLVAGAAAPDEPVIKGCIDPRDPDHSRVGIFVYHNCYRCSDGKKPCIKGNPRDCNTLHARND